MAEAASGDGGGGGGWWGNLMSVAKTKSAEVFEFMKRDFDEFSSAVKSEASTLASQTATAVKETLQLDDEDSAANSVKRSVSTFLGQMKEALSPSPSTEFDEALVIHDGNPIAMTKLQKKIYGLVSDDATYLDPIPDDCAGRFESWLEVATQCDTGGGVLASIDRLTNILAVNPTLQNKYTTLVPDKVSHTDFWQRYLFRKAVLEDAEAEIERRLDRERKQAENYRWEQEDEALVSGSLGECVELTEEEQIRILEQYEKERMERLEASMAAAELSPKPTLSDGAAASDPSPVTDAVIVTAEDPVERDNLTMRDKKDMVIIGNGPDMSQTSSSSKASTDGDWEKEFDMDEATSASPTIADATSEPASEEPSPSSESKRRDRRHKKK